MVNIAFNRTFLHAALFILWGLLAASPHSAWGKDFILYTYHDKPPYFENGDSDGSDVPGIYKAFVGYLNSKQSDINVTLAFRPRKRLEESLLRNRLNGGVLGVNPLWFNDSDTVKYLWSAAFILDQDVVVTQKDKAFTYNQPSDLIGKRMALPRGLYFWGVSELIADNKIWVHETSSDLQGLEMVLLNRVDATITSQITFNYFINTRYTAEQFSVLDTPHDKFDRAVLFPKRYEKIYRVLAPILANAMNDPEWLAVLHSHHYSQ